MGAGIKLIEAYLVTGRSSLVSDFNARKNIGYRVKVVYTLHHFITREELLVITAADYYSRVLFFNLWVGLSYLHRYC